MQQRNCIRSFIQNSINYPVWNLVHFYVCMSVYTSAHKSIKNPVWFSVTVNEKYINLLLLMNNEKYVNETNPIYIF